MEYFNNSEIPNYNYKVPIVDRTYYSEAAYNTNPKYSYRGKIKPSEMFKKTYG